MQASPLFNLRYVSFRAWTKMKVLNHFQSDWFKHLWLSFWIKKFLWVDFCKKVALPAAAVLGVLWKTTERLWKNCFNNFGLPLSLKLLIEEKQCLCIQWIREDKVWSNFLSSNFLPHCQLSFSFNLKLCYWNGIQES